MNISQIVPLILKILQDYLTNAAAIGAVIQAVVVILSGDPSGGAMKLFAALVALFTAGTVSRNVSQNRKLASLEASNAALKARHDDLVEKATHDIQLLRAAIVDRKHAK